MINCCLTIFLLMISFMMISAYPKYQDELKREKRQSSRRQPGGGRAGSGSSVAASETADCDFNSGISVSTCLWESMDNTTVLGWQASRGEDAYWLGGPRKDKSIGSVDGGYAFLETSTLPSGEATNKVSAMLESPRLVSTGSKGHCVSFSYAISGLSADRLRVLLHPIKGEDSDSDDFSNDVVLATLIDDTMEEWKDAQVMYTYPEDHTVSKNLETSMI